MTMKNKNNIVTLYNLKVSVLSYMWDNHRKCRRTARQYILVRVTHNKFGSFSNIAEVLVCMRIS